MRDLTEPYISIRGQKVTVEYAGVHGLGGVGAGHGHPATHGLLQLRQVPLDGVLVKDGLGGRAQLPVPRDCILLQKPHHHHHHHLIMPNTNEREPAKGNKI
ncbi:hypothetical protein E2C01_001451 [Portunus trituberculatus]|uniref:Uncharacterized protein n=1 Tax=Portunus trituberculatus TaxID=210409 RepID=A0A5B7CKG9_PORTR|nr:hypothetical protein [Portunus trituberculatus]